MENTIWNGGRSEKDGQSTQTTTKEWEADKDERGVLGTTYSRGTAAPTTTCSRGSIAPISTWVPAPTTTWSQGSIASITACSQESICPITSTCSEESISPITSIHSQESIPSITSCSQESIAPITNCSRRSISPIISYSRGSTASTVTPSQRSGAPITINSQSSIGSPSTSTDKDMAAGIRTILRRLVKFNAPEHFYGPNFFSPLAQKYPFIRRESAVLVPLIQDPLDGHLRVLLTQRSQLVRSHKGEVAFPGGVRDRTDQSPVETALREAYEEVGLPYDYIHVAAALVPVLTRHDLLIYPIVGVITEPDFKPLCNEEVAKCFTVPLKRFLSDRGHYVRKFRAEQSGREFLAHFFEDRVNGDTQVTFGITAVICMWAAMLVYETKPPFPMYMFEAEELSLPYDRLITEYERLLHTYLTRRLEQIETASRL